MLPRWIDLGYKKGRGEGRLAFVHWWESSLGVPTHTGVHWESRLGFVGFSLTLPVGGRPMDGGMFASVRFPPTHRVYSG